MAMYLGSDKVADNFGTSYNLITDGNEVKTGRMIDGKEEYVKRFSFTIGGKQADFTKSLGFKLNEVIITNIDGAFLSNSDNTFAINSGVSSAVAYDYVVYCASADNTLLVRTYNGNFKSATINVYYIKK